MSRLLRDNFEREYETDGVGLVMPAAIAVDNSGAALEFTVLSFDHGGDRCSDSQVADLGEKT